MGFASKWALVALVVCACAGTLSASGPEVFTTVRVRIVTPAIPANGTVRLSSAEGPEITWSADVLAATDPVVFRHVPPGLYRLTVALPGFRGAAIDASLQAATDYEFIAQLPPANEPAAASLLQLLHAEPIGSSRIFDRSLLEIFPADDALWSVVETAAAPLIVDRMSNGGLWAGEAALVGGNGTSWRQVSIARGDLDVTDPARTGTALMRANHAPFDALLVTTSALPASVAGPGPVLTVVPRSGGSSWHGATQFGAMPGALQSVNAPPASPSIGRFAMHRDATVELGGPLSPRAGVFLSARSVASDRLERNDPTVLRTSVRSVFADTTVITGARSRLQLEANLDHADMPYPGRARFRNRDVRETDQFASASGAWDHWTHGGTAWSASSGFQHGVFNPAFHTQPTPDVSAAGTVERLRDGPVPALFDVLPGTRQRWTARVDVASGFAALGPRHALTAGVNVGRNRAVTRSPISPSVAELVNGLPARIWEYAYGGPETRWTSTELAAYIADGITLPGRIQLDAGVRVEAARGFARGRETRSPGCPQRRVSVPAGVPTPEDGSSCSAATHGIRIVYPSITLGTAIHLPRRAAYTAGTTATTIVCSRTENAASSSRPSAPAAPARS